MINTETPLWVTPNKEQQYGLCETIDVSLLSQRQSRTEAPHCVRLSMNRKNNYADCVRLLLAHNSPTDSQEQKQYTVWDSVWHHKVH